MAPWLYRSLGTEHAGRHCPSPQSRRGGCWGSLVCVNDVREATSDDILRVTSAPALEMRPNTLELRILQDLRRGNCPGPPPTSRRHPVQFLHSFHLLLSFSFSPSQHKLKNRLSFSYAYNWAGDTYWEVFYMHSGGCIMYNYTGKKHASNNLPSL